MIDLSSDTATKPTRAMRHAMAEAEVGDDQKGEDPTVNRLQETVAALLGKEAAIYLPSATMANQIAISVQTRPGDEVICHENAHIRMHECGAPALLSGCLLWPLPGARGVFTGDQVADAVHPDGPLFARTRMVCVENTSNAGGGCVWWPEAIESVADAARAHGLAMHLDGARLMNAAVASGRDPAEICAPFDTVTLCLSKGLGAPVGALLAGKRDAIHEARRFKHAFGGAMRQAGVIAAAGLYALSHHVERLREDHGNAARLAEGLSGIRGVRLDPAPETNIVFVNVAETGLTGPEALARLEAEGVRASGGRHGRLRFVTHLDISREDVDRAIGVARRVLFSTS